MPPTLPTPDTPSLGRLVGPLLTRSRPRGGRTDSAPTGPKSWLGWTDRLLQPRHLYIWGRRGEDWRLTDRVTPSDEVEGAHRVELEAAGRGASGAAHVQPHTGVVLLLDLPGHVTWRLDEVDEDPDVSSWPMRRWFAGCVPDEVLAARAG